MAHVTGKLSTFNLFLEASIEVLSVIMAFLGGAECSTAGNPLTQFTKHVQSDTSLQRDRLVGRGSGGLGESLRRSAAPNGSDQVSFAGQGA